MSSPGSNPKKMEGGSSGGGSILTPSKFSSGFGQSEPKKLFTGLKASRLEGVSHGLGQGSPASGADAPYSKPFVGLAASKLAASKLAAPTLTESTLTAPKLAAPKLSVTSRLPEEKEEKNEKSNDTEEEKNKIPIEEKPAVPTEKESSNGGNEKTSTDTSKESEFLFGQNVADRAVGFSSQQSPNDATKEEPRKESLNLFGQNLADKAENVGKTDTDKPTGEKCDSKESDKQFVFGQNLSDRAANFSSTSDQSSEKSASFVFGQNLSDRAANFPPSSEISKDENSEKEKSEETASKTLTESAAEYIENKAAQKRKYDEVEVTTGEENEFNVIHTRARLYTFENSNWIERGRGQLRLNDMSQNEGASSKVSSSRLVMRTMGSLKVILNTKVYHGMPVEQSNEKSVRLTGMDEHGVAKVFLIMCSPKEAEALYKALKSRLAELKRHESKVEDDAKRSKVVAADKEATSS